MASPAADARSRSSAFALQEAIEAARKEHLLKVEAQVAVVGLLALVVRLSSSRPSAWANFIDGWPTALVWIAVCVACVDAALQLANRRSARFRRRSIDSKATERLRSQIPDLGHNLDGGNLSVGQLIELLDALPSVPAATAYDVRPLWVRAALVGRPRYVAIRSIWIAVAIASASLAIGFIFAPMFILTNFYFLAVWQLLAVRWSDQRLAWPAHH